MFIEEMSLHFFSPELKYKTFNKTKVIEIIIKVYLKNYDYVPNSLLAKLVTSINKNWNNISFNTTLRRTEYSPYRHTTGLLFIRVVDFRLWWRLIGKATVIAAMQWSLSCRGGFQLTATSAHRSRLLFGGKNWTILYLEEKGKSEQFRVDLRKQRSITHMCGLWAILQFVLLASFHHRWYTIRSATKALRWVQNPTGTLILIIRWHWCRKCWWRTGTWIDAGWCAVLQKGGQRF